MAVPQLSRRFRRCGLARSGPGRAPAPMRHTPRPVCGAGRAPTPGNLLIVVFKGVCGKLFLSACVETGSAQRGQALDHRH